MKVRFRVKGRRGSLAGMAGLEPANAGVKVPWAGPYFMVNLEQKFTILYFTQISNYQDWRIIWKIRNVLYDAIL